MRRKQNTMMRLGITYSHRFVMRSIEKLNAVSRKRLLSAQRRSDRVVKLRISRLKSSVAFLPQESWASRTTKIAVAKFKSWKQTVTASTIGSLRALQRSRRFLSKPCREAPPFSITLTQFQLVKLAFLLFDLRRAIAILIITVVQEDLICRELISLGEK